MQKVKFALYSYVFWVANMFKSTNDVRSLGIYQGKRYVKKEKKNKNMKMKTTKKNPKNKKKKP